MDTTRQQRLAEFVNWTSQHIRGDDKGEAQIYLDRLFQAFGQPGVLEVGGQTEFRVLAVTCVDDPSNRAATEIGSHRRHGE